MNAIGDTPDHDPERGEEPPIILFGIEKSSYYMYKGEDFLNELLLADGEFPKPVLCVHFETLFDAKRIVGDGFSPGQSWSIHPEIIERLRRDDCLVETDA